VLRDDARDVRLPAGGGLAVQDRAHHDLGELLPTAVRRAFTVIELIPAVSGCAYDALAAALTGRLDPTPDVAAAGAWKDARWGREIQEALSARRRACRSNVVRCDGSQN
jgi:hypothetical protein